MASEGQAGSSAGGADVQAAGENENFMRVVDLAARTVPDGEANGKGVFVKRAWGYGQFSLHRDSFPRRQCIKIVQDPRFDHLILGLIGLNCITMALFASPIVNQMLTQEFNGRFVTDVEMQEKSLWAAKRFTFALLRPASESCTLNDMAPCSIAQITDFIFLLIFTVEMFIKMLAMGCYKDLAKRAYFRSGWNWLDFIVVVVGWLEFFAGGGLPAISTIRLVKTFRPLRSMQRIRGLRVLVQSILDSLPQMNNVALFLFFTLVLFGLFGHAFFKGRLRHSCHEEVEPGVWESTGATCDPQCTWNEQSMTLAPSGCLSLGVDTKQMESHAVFGVWSYSCRRGQQCMCNEHAQWTDVGHPFGITIDPAACSQRDNPNYGITSFDSLPWAMVSLFQAISLEGWVDMMYQLMDGGSDGGTIFTCTYFILLILFGAIIVMNLFLAVLCDGFDMAQKDGDPPEEEVDAEVEAAKEAALLSHDNKFRQQCLNLVRWKPYDYFIQGCIIFNTIVMMCKATPSPRSYIEASMAPHEAHWDYMMYEHFWVLSGFNIVLTLIFTFESVVKVIGLGPKLYKKDAMNLFDAFVVVFSIIELGLDLNKRANPDAGVEIGIPLSVLRAFRIFRLFKLARSVESLRKIISTLFSSMRSVVYLALLLGLIILIFILLGMELFGGRYPHPEYNFTVDNFPIWASEDGMDVTWPDSEPSRYSFDDFGTALLAIFVVLSGENWNEIMFDSHRVSWDSNAKDDLPLPYAIIYFLLLFVIGNLLLFNLFIAILLSNFDDEEEEAEEENTEVDTQKQIEWAFGQYRDTELKRDAIRKSYGSGDETGSGGEAEEKPESTETKEELEAKALAARHPMNATEGGGSMSLFVLSWDNPIRQFCAHFVRHKYFEGVVLVLILLSTLALIIDMPYYSENSPYRLGIKYCNIVFTVLFTIEMCLKIVAQGFLISKTPKQFVLSEAYLRSAWNVLDFFIVIVSLVSLLGIPAIRQLRVFRSIRPMRLVSRYESLKITFQTLIKSIPAMSVLIVVALLFFIIFGILGLELFGGKMGFCYDPLFGDEEFGSRVIPGMRAGQNDYEECMALPRYNLTRRTTDGILFMDMADADPSYEPDWLIFTEFPQWMWPQFGTFDNIGHALILLFEVSALEGWPDVMHWAMDTDGKEMFVTPWRIDTNPINWDKPGEWDVNDPYFRGAAPPADMGIPTDTHITSNVEAAVFFILWIIFGCFVIVNMTIGIVVDTFSEIKAKNDGLLLMSAEAGDWVRTQKQVLAQRPLRAAEQPTAAWRLNFYYLATSTRFEIFIMMLIMTNMLQMGLDWWEPAVNLPEIQQLKDTMSIINILFFVAYVIEMLLKWLGIGVVQYFKTWWNVFDFLLVIISLVDVIFSPPVQKSGTELGFPAAVLRVLRLFRVARILRIVKTAKNLRTIMMTVYISVPQLKNILLLMVMIIIIVDMLLVGFFSNVNYTPGNYDFAPHTTETFMTTDSYLRGERYYASDWHFNDEGTNWGDMINRHANFAFFWTGLLTLVRSSTGESFNGIMHDLFGWDWGHNRMTCCKQCGPLLDGDLEPSAFLIRSTNVTIFDREIPQDSCGISAVALIIYFVFQLVMAYIVLSIMIGIILENFANVGSEAKKVSLDDIEDFREVWLKYDPKGTFIVPSHNLLAILQQLKEPLGIQGRTPPLTRAEMLKHLGTLDIPDHGGFIHFMETLTAVSNAHAGVPVPVCETTNKMADAAKRVPGLKKLEKPQHNALTNYLVSLLQSRWRGYAMRDKYQREAGGGVGDMPADAPQTQPYDGPSQGKVKANQVAPQPS